MFFFQAFTKKPIEAVAEKDLYDQLQSIVVTLLNYELPTHYQGNHILYSANIQLSELKELASYHRSKINMYSAVGKFHKEAYELTVKRANQLQLTIDAYISLHIDTDRERINNRLRFSNEKVISLYDELLEFKNQELIPSSLEESYWSAFKEDLMPILAELR